MADPLRLGANGNMDGIKRMASVRSSANPRNDARKPVEPASTPAPVSAPVPVTASAKLQEAVALPTITVTFAPAPSATGTSSITLLKNVIGTKRTSNTDTEKTQTAPKPTTNIPSTTSYQAVQRQAQPQTSTQGAKQTMKLTPQEQLEIDRRNFFSVDDQPRGWGRAAASVASKDALENSGRSGIDRDTRETIKAVKRFEGR